jgi:hypothetical protein
MKRLESIQLHSLPDKGLSDKGPFSYCREQLKSPAVIKPFTFQKSQPINQHNLFRGRV